MSLGYRHNLAYMEPLCTMIPILVQQSNMFPELSDKLKEPWPYKQLQNVPQNNKGECAIYAVKFIEFDSAGIGFDVLNDASDETIQFFRNKMAIDI